MPDSPVPQNEIPVTYSDAHGKVLAQTESEGLGVVKAVAVDLIPTTVYGFAIEHKLGPYPIDAPRSHRQAIYVLLRPISAQAIKICRRAGQDLVMAVTPLTVEGALDIAADPQGTLAEKAVKDTLAVAVAEVRKHAGGRR